MLGSCLVASDRQLATKRRLSQTLAGSDHYPITLYCSSFPAVTSICFHHGGGLGELRMQGVSLLQGEIRTLLRLEEEPSTSFTCQSAPVCAVTECSLPCTVTGCSLLVLKVPGTTLAFVCFFFLLRIWTREHFTPFVKQATLSYGITRTPVSGPFQQLSVAIICRVHVSDYSWILLY